MIIHIDMDAFFASVEVLDNPDLRGRCVVVGGRSKRGVVAAASYEARKFGIHSAMPMFQARQRCADLVIVAPHRQRYKELSHRIMAILREYTPLVEPVSIDEAFIDVESSAKLFGSPQTIGADIKNRIFETVKLTCSVGIAPNKFLAKIASDIDKPDGMTVILPEQVAAFVQTLPIRKVPGVGKATQNLLDQIGIRTLGDVARYPEETLVKRLGKYGRRLAALARGEDASPVTPYTPAKSVSSEETLPENTRNRKILNRYLLRQSEDVARQLRKLGLRAKTVTLKVKHDDFKLSTRSKTPSAAIQSSRAIYREALGLLDEYRLTHKLRLIGVGASGLVSEKIPVQMTLFEKVETGQDHWEKVDVAVDSILDKFGKGVVKKASLE